MRCVSQDHVIIELDCVRSIWQAEIRLKVNTVLTHQIWIYQIMQVVYVDLDCPAAERSPVVVGVVDKVQQVHHYRHDCFHPWLQDSSRYLFQRNGQCDDGKQTKKRLITSTHPTDHVVHPRFDAPATTKSLIVSGW